MLQCLQGLSGLVLVADVWESPSRPLLVHLCKQKPASTVFVCLETPAHQVGNVGCRVVDMYAKEPVVAEQGRDVTLLIVDGVSDWLRRCGVAEVLRAMFRLLVVHASVVVTVHADVVDPHALAALLAASSTYFRLSGANLVSTLSKRKGGKVVRSVELVIDWKGPNLKPVDVKVGYACVVLIFVCLIEFLCRLAERSCRALRAGSRGCRRQKERNFAVFED